MFGFFFLYSLVPMIIGALVGRPKGRMSDGILGGMVLSWLGVAIVALQGPLASHRCLFCGHAKAPSFPICGKCGRG